MSVNGPQSPMGPSRPEAIVAAPAQPYDAGQSQYVPPLQSWPPQAPVNTVYIERPPSLFAPWAFVVVGLIIPLSALITAIWALRRWRFGDDKRCGPIAVVGFAIVLMQVALFYSARG